MRQLKDSQDPKLVKEFAKHDRALHGKVQVFSYHEDGSL